MVRHSHVLFTESESQMKRSRSSGPECNESASPPSKLLNFYIAKAIALEGLASYCKAETTFTFHFSILALSNASFSINNRAIKSESGFSFALASQPFQILQSWFIFSGYFRCFTIKDFVILKSFFRFY